MTSKRLALRLAAALAALTIADASLAQQKQAIHFAQGRSETSVKGAVRGDEFVDYIVRASAGQTMKVSLKATNTSTYFNVTPPASNAAMFIGSTSGDTFTRALPSDGEYTIRVYLMRNAGRRHEESRFDLHVGVNGHALAALPASADAKIKGTPYHASTQVPCKRSLSDAAEQCEAYVIRRGRDGTATVEVRMTDGYTIRRILFVKTAATGSDSPSRMSSERKDDLTIITFEGGEAVTVPDMLLTGG